MRENAIEKRSSIGDIEKYRTRGRVEGGYEQSRSGPFIRSDDWADLVGAQAAAANHEPVLVNECARSRAREKILHQESAPSSKSAPIQLDDGANIRRRSARERGRHPAAGLPFEPAHPK